MQTGIYEIVNTVNGKRYVGSSVNIPSRWKSHLRELRRGTHHAKHLQHSFNIYGEEKFILVIIRYCERDDLLYYEQEELDSGFDYNSSPTAKNCLGIKLDAETRERYRQQRYVRRDADPEAYSALMSSLSKGKPKPEGWKAKMSQRHSGVPKTISHVKKMAKARAVLTEDTVREIRRRCDSGETQSGVALDLSLTKTTVQRVASRDRYTWVE